MITQRLQIVKNSYKGYEMVIDNHALAYASDTTKDITAEVQQQLP